MFGCKLVQQIGLLGFLKKKMKNLSNILQKSMTFCNDFLIFCFIKKCVDLSPSVSTPKDFLKVYWKLAHYVNMGGSLCELQ